jgi:hypothetical protein
MYLPLKQNSNYTTSNKENYLSFLAPGQSLRMAKQPETGHISSGMGVVLNIQEQLFHWLHLNASLTAWNET